MRLEQKYVDIAIEQTEKEAKEKSVIFNGEFKENEELSKSQRINEPPYKNKELDI